MEAIDARRDREIVSGILVVQVNKTKKKITEIDKKCAGIQAFEA